MDSSNENPYPGISNQPNLSPHFPINVHTSSSPTTTIQNPHFNPHFSQTPGSNENSVQDDFIFAATRKGRRSRWPWSPAWSFNKVQICLSSNNGLSNAGVLSLASNSRQVNKGQMKNSIVLTSQKRGSSSNSGNLSGRTVDDISDEITVINKEATAEASIALTSGFPSDWLIEEEIDYGVVSEVDGIEQINYVLIRNHIIRKWRGDVSNWVTKEMFVDIVPKHCGALLDTAYVYLVSHGYINFGVAPEIKERILVEPRQPNVIVVGAGLAGLAAARQLMAFGFNVTVLEGRKRVGGRVYTKKWVSGNSSVAVDLGGSVLTGTLGNPLAILAQQFVIKTS